MHKVQFVDFEEEHTRQGSNEVKQSCNEQLQKEMTSSLIAPKDTLFGGKESVLNPTEASGSTFLTVAENVKKGKVCQPKEDIDGAVKETTESNVTTEMEMKSGNDSSSTDLELRKGNDLPAKLLPIRKMENPAGEFKTS